MRRARRDLLQIAIEALQRAPGAEDDLDWFICWRIRIWERSYALVLYQRGLDAAYGRFDIHRWQRICCRVRGGLYGYLSKVVEARRAEGAFRDEDIAGFFATFDVLVASECEKQHVVLRREVKDRGLEALRPLLPAIEKLHAFTLNEAKSLDSQSNMEPGALLGRYLL